MLASSAVSLLVLVPAIALGEGRFDELRKEAQPFDGGLGEFLELYLGDCGTASSTANCRNRSREFQSQTKGKRFYALVREDEAGMVGMSESTRAGGDFTIEVTPFFPGAEHALTNAVPKKTDPKGNPNPSRPDDPGEAAGDRDGGGHGATVQEPRRAARAALPARAALGVAEEGRRTAHRGEGEARCHPGDVADRRGARDLDRARRMSHGDAPLPGSAPEAGLADVHEPPSRRGARSGGISPRSGSGSPSGAATVLA